MKKFTVKLERNGALISANVYAFSKRGAIKKAYRKYGR